jgi:hypothetical protein
MVSEPSHPSGQTDGIEPFDDREEVCMKRPPPFLQETEAKLPAAYPNMTIPYPGLR